MSNLITPSARNNEGLVVRIRVISRTTGLPVTGLGYSDFSAFTLTQDGATSTPDPTAGGFAEEGGGYYLVTLPSATSNTFEGGQLDATPTNADHFVDPGILAETGAIFKGTLDTVSGTTVSVTGLTLPAGSFLRVKQGGGINRSAYLSADNTLIAAISGLDTSSVVEVFPDGITAVGGSGGGGDDAATVYSYFTASNREDVFKADVSGLATSSELATLDSVVDAVGVAVAAVDTAVGNLPTPPSEVAIADAVKSRQLAESYAADGTPPTLEQALMLIQQVLTDFGISGTTLTARRLDGSTAAAQFTLDDADAPTSVTRSS